LVLLGYALLFIAIVDREGKTSIGADLAKAGIDPLLAGGISFGLFLSWIAWRSSIWYALAFVPAMQIYLVFGIFLAVLQGFGEICSVIGQEGRAKKCSNCGTLNSSYSSTCSGCTGHFMN